MNADQTPATPRRRSPIRIRTPRSRRSPLPPEEAAQRAAVLRANLAAYKARTGRGPTRKGIPDGWAGRALSLLPGRGGQQGRGQSRRGVAKLVSGGVLQRDATGSAALAWAVGVVLATDPATGRGCYSTRDRLAAARLVVDFRCARPVERSEVAMTAEAVLGALLAG